MSPWHEIGQDRVDMFAEATGDRQWIHVDPVRAAAGPFGGPIAHGYLTLALAPMFIADVLVVEQLEAALNYGLNKVRFPAPVPVGSRVRGVVTLKSAERDRPGSRPCSPWSTNSRARSGPPASPNSWRSIDEIRTFVLGHMRRTEGLEFFMPEAVIVAATRSPIGRAFKGSLETSVPTTWPRPSSGPRWTRYPNSTSPTSTT